MRCALPLRLGAAAATVALGGCVSSEPGGSSLEANLLAQTLNGTGLVSSETAKIDYRTRSPLVLPSRYDLRPPEDPSLESRAAWPKDPDVARGRAKAADEAMPIDDYRRREGIGEQGGRVLSADEMERGRRAGAGLVPNDVPSSAASPAGRNWGVLLPNEYQGTKSEEQKQQEAAVASGVEPPRRYLTEPPSGYRARVPSKTVDGQPAPAEPADSDKPWYKRLWSFGS